MIILPPIKSKKAKELDRTLAHQQSCKKKFVDTTQKVNGYLKEQIEKLPRDTHDHPVS